MRDDLPRVGRPRKGAQRKPKDRPERYRPSAAQGSFAYRNEEDFHIPNNKGPASPVNMLTSPTSISSAAMSVDSISSEINQFEENDSEMASQDNLCAFCNCGSEMAQILGQINRYFPSQDFNPFSYEDQTGASHSMESSVDKFFENSRDASEQSGEGNYLLKSEKRSVGRPPGKKKKRGKQLLARHQHLSADMSTFGTAIQPEIPDVFDADGCIWAHHCCAAWSAGVCQTDSYDLENVDKAAFKAITKQCSHCNRHGASVDCQMQKCTKLYHYPCCASSGAFQDIKSMILLCPDHLDQATRLAGSEAFCVLCDKAGEISKQLFCTSCGRHYHGQCLDPPVTITATVRMGWQCPECKVCQGCRQPGDDEKMLFCDECDKGFHTYCLSPPMSSVPKTAWKCYRCRKCEDCGSNVPGSGPSCRWHFNYTVCDRCYQQRKKGAMPCCPMCGKAVRSASGEFSKQCAKCCKQVHCRCDRYATTDAADYFCPGCRHDVHDDDSEISAFMDHKEESNDSLLLNPVHSSTSELDPEFLGQRTVTIAEAEAISRAASGFMQREPSPLLEQNEMEDLDLKGIDINFDEVMMETGLHGPLIHDLEELKPDSGDSLNSPPHISSTAAYLEHFPSHEDKEITLMQTSSTGKAGRGKKKMPPLRCRGRPPGTAGRAKKSKGQRSSRPRSKSVSTSGSNKENIQSGIVNFADSSRKDDSDDPEGLHSTVVMISTKDRFTLEQDICMCCGSFGKGSEGHLITCAQCGQCFHPYCVNVKVSKVVMTKGWRCLDCTVCEGCGKNEDEGKLLLCDGCDISYHIYCLDPPLDEVPSDGWKCQWCVECVKCGGTSPGVGCKWMSSYTQCGPCASDLSCPVCSKTYLDDELVVKCMHCSRWLHAECDGLASEDDAELAASYVYHCRLCRGETGHYGIFSTSWTNIIERGIYSTSSGKLSTLQSIVVTQTTTTVMATGIANRRTKNVAVSKSSRNPLTASGWNQRQPQHPVQASAQGTFEVQLPGLRLKGRREEAVEADAVSLTDSGMKQIKSLVVKASSRSHSRNKDKQGKLTSIDDRATERETKTAGQLTETSTCSEDIGENRQPVCLAGDPVEGASNAIDGDLGNKKMEKRGPGRPTADKQVEQAKVRKAPERRDDPLDFFGPGLLKLSKKKRKKDSLTENETQSSEDEATKNSQYPENRNNDPPDTAKLKFNNAQHPDQSSALSRSHVANWPAPTGHMKPDSLSGHLQNPDSLYKTLNILVNTPERGDDKSIHHDQSLGQERNEQTFGTPKALPSRHVTKSSVSDQTSAGMNQGTDMTQTGDLDLIGLSDLPHVDGHEVEEIFAGIEREMSVDGTPQSHCQSPMDTAISEYPKAGEKAKAIGSPRPFQGQHRLAGGGSQRPDPVLPPGYPDQQQQRINLNQPEFAQYDMYRANQTFPLEHDMDYKPSQKAIQSQPGETDAFKAVFGEEPEIKSKPREGATSPKIDGQKQLRKWEQDEKLESLSTISPVLYANIVHPELKVEYPEWPNRARAIARLWRKLPQEQREPFRLRARDNRVKQKDQGRKLGPFQKTTPTTADGNDQSTDSSSNLTTPEVTASGSLTKSSELAAVKALSGTLLPNGERTSLATNQQHDQNALPRYAYGGMPLANRPGSETRAFPLHPKGALISPDNVLQPCPQNQNADTITSPNGQFIPSHSQHGGMPRPASKGNSRPQSLSELMPTEMQLVSSGLTPTTPVFPTSPFQSPLSGDISNSPVVMSQSLPTDPAVGEKRKLKKQARTSKEQSDTEKEEKKRKLALEQEKERQWKLLQQQRLKEQQSHHQTPTIQQVIMMKEQMRKDNNKAGRKPHAGFAAEQDQVANEFRPSVLPPVKPLAVGQTKQRAANTAAAPVTTPTSMVSHIEYPVSNSSAQHGFLTNDMIARDAAGQAYAFENLRSDQPAELDTLMEISTTDLMRIGGSRPMHSDSGINTTAGLPPAYDTVVSAQAASESVSKAASKAVVDFMGDKATVTSGSTIIQQHQRINIPISEPLAPSSNQSGIFGIAASSQSESKSQRSTDSQISKAMSGFLLDTSTVQSAANDAFDKQQAGALRPQQQQQQALLFQQQQFIAAQQQYIQWQLQQRNPELFQSVATPVQYSSYTDKDLPEVDSEEQHQERIRFLYRQRQMQKQQVVQLQQQLHHQQVFAQQQVAPTSSGSAVRPQVDQAQQQFIQQLLQYQQQIPEALQQQFLLEYSRQMQQKTDLGQNAMQYEKFLAELAQQYGYPVQQPGGQTVSVVQHSISWPNATAANVHPNMQQVFAYGAIDEEKAKDLTPQQIYQLQMQQTILMQMAASGMYPSQPAPMRSQAASTSTSRKSSAVSSQTKKSRDSKKQEAQEKQAKADSNLNAKTETKMVQNSRDGGKVPEESGAAMKVSSESPSWRTGSADQQNSSEEGVRSEPNSEGSVSHSQSNSLPMDKDATPALNSSVSNSTRDSPSATNRLINQDLAGKEKSTSMTEKTEDVSTSSVDALQKAQGNSLSSEKTVCSDGIHCGTDSESEDAPGRVANNGSLQGKKAGDGRLKPAGSSSKDCHDGVHCGTESEDDENLCKVRKSIKIPCTDGIHCGTDSESEEPKGKPKQSCSDGVHCGTDSEGEEFHGKSVGNSKQPCLDGIHCGTDSEDEKPNRKKLNKRRQQCTDGLHCGTDSEDEERDKRASGQRQPCYDGIHCGTDSEGEEQGKKTGTFRKQCSDGIHCGTDSENEDHGGKKASKYQQACSDGIHCGTDSEDEKPREKKAGKYQQACSDGIHCGTDSEDEKPREKKAGRSSKPCSDGIHCGTDSEEENDERDNRNISSRQETMADVTISRLGNICSDGIHCGTDSESEDDAGDKKPQSSSASTAVSGAISTKGTAGQAVKEEGSGKEEVSVLTPKSRPLVVVCRQETSVASLHPRDSTARSISGASSSLVSTVTARHTVEVIQEGDVTQSTFNALENMSRNLKDSKIDGSLQDSFNVAALTASSESNHFVNAENLISNLKSAPQPSQTNETTNQTVIPAKHSAAHKPLLRINSSSPITTADNEKTVLHSIASTSAQPPPSSTKVSTQSAPEQRPFPTMSQPMPYGSPKDLLHSKDTPQTTMPQPPQVQPFSPKVAPHTPNPEQSSAPRQKQKAAGIPPTSPQYQQLFMHQHQLLIMQFQQYQFQLQAQYQQLSQQQMSPQQQFLLQQQYHQQMMLLQRQFVQQQAQLQTMASTGMQFTEQELNVMYQQQMVAQQAYKQWVATLTLDQQGQLHARMQANMQQVQQGMAAIMQNTLKNVSENAREKPRKQRGRRPRKSKGDSTDPPTPAPSTPTQPQTPASLGDAPQPSTPNKETELEARTKAQVPGTVVSQMQGGSKGLQNQASQGVLYGGQATSMANQVNMYAVVHPEQVKPMPANEHLRGQASYVTNQAAGEPRMPSAAAAAAAARPDWQQIQLQQSIQQQQQPYHAQQPQSAVKTLVQTSVQSQRPQYSRTGIPDGGLPLADVYQEMELKSKAVSKMPVTPSSQAAHPGIQGLQTAAVEPWKVGQTNQASSHKPDQRAAQPPVNSSSGLSYQNATLPIRSQNEGDYFNQSRRQAVLQPQGQPQGQPLQSPPFIPTQNTMMSMSSAQYSVTTTLGTQASPSVIDSSQLLPNKSAAAQLPSESMQHHQQWVQVTSVNGGHLQQGPVVLSQAQQMPQTELQRQASATYPLAPNPTDDLINVSQAYPQMQVRSTVPNEGHIAPNPAVRSPLHYPPGYVQAQIQQQSTHPASSVPYAVEQNPSQINLPGDSSAKEGHRAGPKKKKSAQTNQVSSGNVDFSLLNPEEQKKFLLERKKEDFERRRRLLEEQRQMRLKDQENQRTVSKKVEKKVPRTKQPRKVKGNSKEREPMPKSPVRLILEDKGLRLPLCEPEVRLLYPLVQPFGSGYLNRDKMLLGTFGSATVQGQCDYYAQFPSPNPPVTSSNPPTPPASLPPSPGTINQSLRDSLQMIPTEGIFEDLVQKSDSNKNASLPRHDERQSGSLQASCSGSNEQNESEDGSREDTKDGVLVTLTMSGRDHRSPNERVSAVTNILGVNKPQTVEIVDEKPGSRRELVDESSLRRPTATSIGNENDVHFSCLNKGNFKDNEGNKAPFCKHCDISIQGSGYVECRDASTLNNESTCISMDDTKFVKATIAPGDDLSFVFCSQMCLKSYYSLKSRMTSGSGQGPYADDSGEFIDPVRSVIPVSTGEASNAGFHSSTDALEIRGEMEASAPASVLVKRKSFLTEDDFDRKKPRLVIWKRWKIIFNSDAMKNDTSKLTAAELLEKYGAALKAESGTQDERQCMLCGDVGDGVTEGTARLINYDVNVWVHLNCALWSLEVYETLNGALHNVQKAFERGIQTFCVYCSKKGATVTCARVIGSQMRRCEMNYHFNCAIKANCVFFKDKTVLCPQHKNYGSAEQRLPSYAVLRKVYVNRDITKQLARVLRFNNEKEQSAFTVRIGSLIFHELGQLLPHQLQKFHSKDAIYPVGFKTTRFYWSTEQIGKRRLYVNSIEEVEGSPHFVISIKDCGKKVGEFAGSTPKEVWSCVFEPVRRLREGAKMVKIFPEFVTGEDLFGLSDPSIQRIIESLPGVETVYDYSFRFGRTPMIMTELPLAVNPTGCIRSESTRNVHQSRPVSLRTASSTPMDRVERCDSLIDEGSQGSLLRNSWAISKTAQYRRMKSEWKNYVLLSKSRIQGLGLFAVRDIEPNTMIIEYIGSIIRNEVANKRERIYENSNRGVYMFRVDSDTVIDATLTGGPARYINHSCDPNCVAEVVIIEKMPKIIIISNRKLEKGEELTYDYKFEFEDDQHKIACLCGAANCRKWMN